MLTLASWIASEGITLADFARRLRKRLNHSVSVQSVWRWTRKPTHPEYCIPQPEALVAIYFETNKQVPLEVWYQHLLPAAARRKVA